jgi:hypothetical protein
VPQVLRDSLAVAEVTQDGQGRSFEHETVIRMQPDLPMMLEEQVQQLLTTPRIERHLG